MPINAISPLKKRSRVVIEKGAVTPREIAWYTILTGNRQETNVTMHFNKQDQEVFHCLSPGVAEARTGARSCMATLPQNKKLLIMGINRSNDGCYLISKKTEFYGIYHE
jgi:hypothetical protein